MGFDYSSQRILLYNKPITILKCCRLLSAIYYNTFIIKLILLSIYITNSICISQYQYAINNNLASYQKTDLATILEIHSSNNTINSTPFNILESITDTGSSCSENLIVKLRTFSTNFSLILHKNQFLVSENFVFKKQSELNKESLFNNIIAQQNSKHLKNSHCHYTGSVNNSDNSDAAISLINGKNPVISGLFRINNSYYYLDKHKLQNETIIRTHLISSNFTEHIEKELNYPRKFALTRHKRSQIITEDNSIIHGSDGANSSSLYVELLVVHDHSQYLDAKKNETEITERTLQIVNLMNAFYRELNIYIGLVGIVVWDTKDEIQLTSDGDSTLTDFLKYRLEQLVPKFHHDNAQLITKTSFNNSVVGKALKGTICTHEHSGGVNTDHSDSAAIVAATLSHELGHNLGMDHDNETCKCLDDKCIMSSSANTVHPRHWSTCSTKYLQESKEHGLLRCLEDVPTKIYGPICGNGFVEDGEDCDPGEPLPIYGISSIKRRLECKNNIKSKYCEPYLKLNPCCNPITCKFNTNATCASGACCNLETCSVFNATDSKVCRPKQTECDLEEVCDGKNEHCPQDVYFHDGLECGISTISEDYVYNSLNYNRSKAFCYKGKCASHQSQCHLLWGPNARVSKDICFNQNIHGNTSGNCGYDRNTKTYLSCNENDSICGMLHCIHNQETDLRKTGKLNYGFESASTLTVLYFSYNKKPDIYCHGTLVDAGPGFSDPGLVPDGASCGDDRMCLDQKCIPVDELLTQDWCSSGCNGNGVCDNTGICHCFDGRIGTHCFGFFGYIFHLISIFFYLLLFFVPAATLALIMFNRYKPQIKSWWLRQARTSIQRRKTVNSSYITQARRNNSTNATVQYQFNKETGLSQSAILDPWANSNQTQTLNPSQLPVELNILTSEQIPGFKLEPLQKQEKSGNKA